MRLEMRLNASVRGCFAGELIGGLNWLRHIHGPGSGRNAVGFEKAGGDEPWGPGGARDTHVDCVGRLLTRRLLRASVPMGTALGG